MTEAVIIVGAGQAGAHAALAMRGAGFGGPILLMEAEAERPHERPPLSKQMLTAAEEPPVAYFHPETRYADSGIDFMGATHVTAIDLASHLVHLQDGRALSYARLLLTTGGRARRLDVPGGERALTMRTLEDARRLRSLLRPGARVVCVGAGVIGLEVASSAWARGCIVTVLESSGAVMGRSLAPAMSAWLAGLHRKAGVDVRLGIGVSAVTDQGVICTDGIAIPADTVVAGIGMERDTCLAVSAGLAVDGGIVVDEFGRTSAADVYAAGDVAAFWVPRLGRRMRLESWRHAQNHGTAVGRAMAGSPKPYDEIPWFWTDQHGVSLQVAGTCEGAVTTVVRGEAGTDRFSAWYLDQAGVPIGVAGVDAAMDVRAAQGMIRAGRPVDAGLLADTTLSPRHLAAAATMRA